MTGRTRMNAEFRTGGLGTVSVGLAPVAAHAHGDEKGRAALHDVLMVVNDGRVVLDRLR